MDKKFNLSGLHNIFIEAVNRNEPTIAFEIKNGRGRFLFIMFFDKDDKKSKDYLFIFLKNTRRMLKLGTYGSHFKGQFDVYIKPFMERWFKDELQISNSISTNPFHFDTFFENLNKSIPHHLPLTTKINVLRESWDDIKGELPSDIVDENDKIYLKTTMLLPKNKKPKEKTLRKLYLYTNGNPNDIAELIENLKKMNTTVKWTNDENFKRKTIRSIINEI